MLRGYFYIICTIANLIFAEPPGKASAKIDEDMKVRVDNHAFPYTHSCIKTQKFKAEVARKREYVV